MKNLIQSTTDFAISIAKQYIRPDSLVIDATCGNGHDTYALAEAIDFSTSRLLAVDIQKPAIETTKALLAGTFKPLLDCGRIVLKEGSHQNLRQMTAALRASDDMKDRPVCLIVFNLGYLPGGDKSLTTTVDSTLDAVSASLDLIAPGGLVCMTMYSGHEAGAKEKQALIAFAKELDSRKYHVAYISMVNQKNDPPEILLITRKS